MGLKWEPLDAWKRVIHTCDSYSPFLKISPAGLQTRKNQKPIHKSTNKNSKRSILFCKLIDGVNLSFDVQLFMNDAQLEMNWTRTIYDFLNVLIREFLRTHSEIEPQQNMFKKAITNDSPDGNIFKGMNGKTIYCGDFFWVGMVVSSLLC